MEHDEIRSDIPTWAAGRLDPAARQRLESHLAECTACGTVASTALALARATARDGAELFEAHPDEEDLRLHAAGIPSPRDRDIARHVASCASCSLELRAWQVRRTAGNPDGQRRPWWRDVRMAAAGLAAGLLLGLLVPRIVEPREPATVVPTPVPRVTLQAAFRGPGGEPELIWGESQTQALIDVAFVLPAEIDPAASVRFEILDAAGRPVWATTESASSLASGFARHELIGFLVPTRALVEGSNRLEVSIEHTKSPALLVVPFHVRRARSR